MGGALTFLMLLALALIGAPIALSAAGSGLGAMTTTIMMVSGIALLIVTGILIIVTRLYVKTKADEAFVRTGMGGLRIIQDGGAVVIPVIHQIVGVQLRTFRLEVHRQGADALLTSDKLRADIRAEFFVRVMANEDDITNAARSLGDRAGHEVAIKGLIEDKLVSALRTVAATKTLEALNSKRDEFVQEVMTAVSADLKHNGFTLETATISALDQADTRSLRDDNVFDAEGKLTIARITQEKMTERNLIERERERERLGQDVEAKKKMLALEQDRAEAQAEQSSAIAKANAEQEKEAREKQISALQAVEVAEQRRQQAVAVAEQEKSQGIAKAEAEKAKAEELRSQAKAAAERARQLIETATVEETALREKGQNVIAAEAEAEQAFVGAQRKADADAYRVEKDASARKAAADAEAEAIRKRAAAEAEAAKRRAEGEQALQMVPVDVEKERVGVQERQADVEIKLLAKREEYGRAGIELQIRQAEIAAQKEAAIESAKAMGTALAAAHMTLWGTPESLGKVSEMFLRGQSFAQLANGFGSVASDELKGAATGILSGGVELLRALAGRLGVPEEELLGVAREVEAEAAREAGKAKPAAQPPPPPAPR